MAATTPSVETGGKVARSSAALEFLKASPKKLLIGGKWVAAKSGKTFETINPATEEVLALVAEGDKADVDEAVKAARKAFEEGKWSKIGPHQRARYLFKIADLIDQHADELAELETLDNGKAKSQALAIDVAGSAEPSATTADGAPSSTAKPIRPTPRCSTTRCASPSACADKSFRGISR